MNYQKILRDNQITDADMTRLLELFRARASAADHANMLPDSIYESAAVDIAMGAIDLCKDTHESMQEGHDARHWLHILTGLSA
jgi:hypothetical protein